jgi:hypothetical protein
MKTTNSNNLIPNDNGKEKKEVLNFIKTQVEKGTGLNLTELRKKYNEEVLFFIALKHVTTTKKALCKSLNLNIDNACRFKRNYELKGLLKESINNVICPFTKYPAKLLSANPDEFEQLTYSNQYKLF